MLDATEDPKLEPSENVDTKNMEEEEEEELEKPCKALSTEPANTFEETQAEESNFAEALARISQPRLDTEEGEKVWVSSLERFIDALKAIEEAHAEEMSLNVTSEELELMTRDLPKVIWTVFFETAVPLTGIDMVQRLCHQVLSLAIKFIFLDLKELNEAVLLILDGPVHTPRSPGLLKDSHPQEVKDILKAAATGYAPSGTLSFYQKYGKPSHISVNGERVSFWPCQTERVEQRMRKRIGQQLKLPSGEIVHVVDYCLSKNMYQVYQVGIEEGQGGPPYWLDLNTVKFYVIRNGESSGVLPATSISDSLVKELGQEDGNARMIQYPAASISSPPSSFLLDALDYFFRIGGFEAMSKRAADVVDPLPLVHLVLFVRSLLSVYTVMNYKDAKLWASTAERLLQAAYVRMNKLSDAELRLFQTEPRVLWYIATYMSKLDPSCFSGSSQGATKLSQQTIAERIILQTMVYYLALGSIESRLFGLRTILDAIRSYTNMSGSMVNLNAAGQSRPPAFSFANIGKPWLLSWLQKVEIVSKLYHSKNLHIELLRKSSSIIVFLGRENAITSQHLKVIWDASVGRDQATMRLVHNLLISLMSRVSHEQRMRFFKNCVSTLPVTEYDEHGDVLRFIFEITTTCLDADNKLNLIKRPPFLSHHKRSLSASLEKDKDKERTTLVSRSSEDRKDQDESNNSAGGLQPQPRIDANSNPKPRSPTTLEAKEPSHRPTSPPPASGKHHHQKNESISSLGSLGASDVASSVSSLASTEGTQSDHQEEKEPAFDSEDYWYGFSILFFFVLDSPLHPESSSPPSPSTVFHRQNGVATNQSNRPLSTRPTSPKTNVTRSIHQRREAIVYLVRLLSEDAWCSSERGNVVEACISNLKEGTSVPQSLDLLKRVINSIPQSKSSWFSLSEGRRAKKKFTIEKLDKQHKVVRLLCSGLKTYQDQVRHQLTMELERSKDLSSSIRNSTIVEEPTEQAEPNGGDMQKTGDGDDVRESEVYFHPDVVDTFQLLGSCYTHLDQLSARFDFLLFLLTNSNLALKKPVAKELWDSMVVNALSPRARDIALSWFGKAQASGVSSSILTTTSGTASGTNETSATGKEGSKLAQEKPKSPAGGGTSNSDAVGDGSTSDGAESALMMQNTVLAVDVPLALFRDEMQNLDVVSLSPVGLRVYQSFFLSINYRNKAIRRSSEGQQPNSAFLSGRRSRRHQEARALARAIVGSQDGGLFEYVERNAIHVEGMEFIWKTALESERNDVGFSAISLLVHLHVRLSPRLKAKRTRLHLDFIHRCVESIEAGKDDEGQPTRDTTRLVRCARRASTTLKLFLSHFRKKRLPKTINLVVIPPAIGFPGSLTRREWISMGVGTLFKVQASEDSKLSLVRELISQSIKFPPEAIEFRLINNPSRVELSTAGNEDMQEWFQTSDYITFSKSSGRRKKAMQQQWCPDPHKPFSQDDLDKTLSELSIQDWDMIKVLDVKIEKTNSQQGNGKTSDPVTAQSQKHADQVTKPIVEKALEFGYGPVSSSSFSDKSGTPHSTNQVVDGLSILDNTHLRYDQDLSGMYTLLFDILDPKGEDELGLVVSNDAIAAQQVWDSLLLLPPDERVIQDITNLDKDLSLLLPSNSTHRLLYSLRLMDSIFLSSDQAPFRAGSGNVALFASALHEGTADAPSSSSSSASSSSFSTGSAAPGSGSPGFMVSSFRNETWINSFVCKGGLDHLVQLLIQQDQLVGGRRVECLCVLVKIVTELLFGDADFRQRMVKFLRGQAPEDGISLPEGGPKEPTSPPVAQSTTTTSQNQNSHKRNVSSSSTMSASSTSSVHGADKVGSRTAENGENGVAEESTFRKFSTMIKNRAKQFGATMRKGLDHSSQSKGSAVRQGTIIEGDGCSLIVTRVLEAMLDATQSQVSNEELRTLVENGLQLVMCCVCFGGTKTITAIMQFKNLREWTERLIIYCDDAAVREAACEGILTLCSLIDGCSRGSPGYWERKVFTLAYLRILLPIVKTLHVPIRADLPGGMLARRAHRNLSQSCSAFYELLCGLVQLVDLHNPETTSFAEETKESKETLAGLRALYENSKAFFEMMFDRTTEALMIHDSLESFHSVRQDNLMIGLLKLIRALIAKCPWLKKRATHCGLVNFLYQDFLFAYGYGAEADLYGVAPRDSFSSKSSVKNVPAGKSPEARVKGMLRRSLSGQSLILHDRSARCKTAQSRNMCMALLIELCSDCAINLAQLLRIIEDEGLGGSERQEFRSRFRTEWNYNPLTLAKHPTQFTGLKNQGATCYMNSLLQQLFHIPSFAEVILGMRAHRSSFLHQLQVTFGSLRVSTRHYYDTMPLCMTLSELDGSPVNLAEQKDANEFATQMFDKLESESLDAKNALREHFGGVLINQIISKDPENPYVSERTEPFLILPLDIRGHSNLSEALAAMVQSELLSGDNQYRLDSGETVDAIKRTCIQTAPNHLIINLKRFEFDLQTLTKHKLNDRFDFPLTLDLEPYTYDYLTKTNHEDEEEEEEEESEHDGDDSNDAGEGDVDVDDDDSVEFKADNSKNKYKTRGEEGRKKSAMQRKAALGPHSDYEYELVGIIAHTGTMDSGHYFSFVRERKARFPHVGGQWMEFNDKLVWPYPIDCIPADCFGGTDSITKSDGTTVQVVKQRSAYMLIYDRKVKSKMSRVEASGSIFSDMLVPELPGDLGGLSERSDSFDQVDDDSEDDQTREEGLEEDDLDDEEYLGGTLDDSDILEARRRTSTEGSSLFQSSEEGVASPSLQGQGNSDKDGLWRQFVTKLGVDEGGARMLHHFMVKRNGSRGIVENEGSKPPQQELDDLLVTSSSDAYTTRLPSHVVEAILKDNLVFTRNNYTFSPATYKFAWNMLDIALKLNDEELLFSTFRVCIKFIVSVGGHAWGPFVNGVFPSWERQFALVLSRSKAACRWLVQEYSQPYWISKVFLECPKGLLRRMMQVLLCFCMTELCGPPEELHFKHERAWQVAATNSKEITGDGENDAPLPDPPCLEGALFQRFVDQWIDILGVKTRGTLASSEYFSVLLRYGCIGETQRRHLLERKVLPTLVETYVSSAPLTLEGAKTFDKKDSLREIAQLLICLMQSRIRASFADESRNGAKSLNEKEEEQDGHDRDQVDSGDETDELDLMAKNVNFLHRLMVNDWERGGDILELACRASAQRSSSILTFLLDAVKRDSSNYVQSHVLQLLWVIERVMLLNDNAEWFGSPLQAEEAQELRKFRIDLVVPKLVKQLSLIHAQQVPKGEFFIFHCSKILLGCAAREPMARVKILEFRKDMENWGATRK